MNLLKPIDIEKNLETFKKEFSEVEREGVDKLLEFIETKTDFKTAPASTKFHLNIVGGLMEHTLNVLRFAREAQKMIEAPGIEDDNITVAALLHDLCKVNYYEEGEEWDKKYKDETNQWRKKKVWKVNDQIPLGHGEKSVILAVRYIPLKISEMAAIRWHMSGFDAGIHFNYPSGFPYRESMDKYPLLKIISIADVMAETYESFTYPVVE